MFKFSNEGSHVGPVLSNAVLDLYPYKTHISLTFWDLLFRFVTPAEKTAWKAEIWILLTV